MTKLNIRFKKLSDTAIPFAYSRDGDACMDIYADEDIVVYPKDTVIVSSGIAVEVPTGYEGIVRGRSGLASKGIYVHTGTIDETYRGSVGIIITNHTNDFFEIKHGMRIAQFTIKPVFYINLCEAAELSPTIRGDKGYGSSGI